MFGELFETRCHAISSKNAYIHPHHAIRYTREKQIKSPSNIDVGKSILHTDKHTAALNVHEIYLVLLMEAMMQSALLSSLASFFHRKRYTIPRIPAPEGYSMPPTILHTTRGTSAQSQDLFMALYVVEAQVTRTRR